MQGTQIQAKFAIGQVVTYQTKINDRYIRRGMGIIKQIVATEDVGIGYELYADREDRRGDTINETQITGTIKVDSTHAVT